KEAKLQAARADLEATRATVEEAKLRFERLVKIRQKNLAGEDDVGGVKLTWERYKQELVSKEAAVRVAELEHRQALIIVTMYKMRGGVNGVIRTIYKRRGEAVKAFEPIVQIQTDE